MPSSGFPTAHHRSKSAFARAQQGNRQSPVERRRDVPKVATSSSLRNSVQAPAGNGLNEGAGDVQGTTWEDQMRHDNARLVEQMSDEERKRHTSEVLDQFGPNLGELVRKMKRARDGSKVGGGGANAESLGGGECLQTTL